MYFMKRRSVCLHAAGEWHEDGDILLAWCFPAALRLAGLPPHHCVTATNKNAGHLSGVFLRLALIFESARAFPALM
jgi:hypothetical protein